MTKETIWILALMLCMIIQEARLFSVWKEMREWKRKQADVYKAEERVFNEIYSNMDKLRTAVVKLTERFKSNGTG